MSSDSSADWRANGGVDRHVRTPDGRAVHVVEAAPSAAAAAVQESDAMHARTANQGPRTQARTVNVPVT